MNHQTIDILLVEDNPGDAFLLQEQLKQSNMMQFNLIHVDYLQKAIANLEQASFDIILLDLILPDSEGMETFLTIQKTSPQTPIVLLTGMDDNDLATEAVRQGAQDYLLKGQTNDTILERSIRYAMERKQVQEQLQQHILELEGFSYMVSHDLRNPLTAIKGMSYLLSQIYTEQQSDQKSQEQEYIEYILNACSRMENLIRDLMMLSQVKHSKLEIDLIDISTIVQQIVSRLQQQNTKQKAKFIVAPQIMAQGSYQLLEIALENLLHNAWKYSSKKENPCIEFGTLSLPAQNLKLKYPHAQNFISLEKTVASKQTIYFVRDNGCGVRSSRRR